MTPQGVTAITAYKDTYCQVIVAVDAAGVVWRYPKMYGTHITYEWEQIT